jgi:hypothetical protein
MILKKILLALLFIISSLFSDTGETGSKNESFQIMVKIELIKEDNSLVTILDGTNFIELKTDGNTTGLGESLEAVRPENGTYKGIKYTAYKFKQKAKIISAGTTYYTADVNITEGASYDLSSDIDNYGYTIVTLPNDVTTVTFPKKLVIADGSDSSIVWINKYVLNQVIYETSGTIESSTNIREIEEATAFLPAIPAKTVVFDVNYTKTSNPTLTNKITAFLDKDGDLIGAYQMRPDSNKALNGSELLQGSKTNNDYTFRFQNGDDSQDGTNGDDYFDVSLSLDCTNSTYSSLVINEIEDGGTPTTAKPNNQDGYTLSVSGSIACTDINITE